MYLIFLNFLFGFHFYSEIVLYETLNPATLQPGALTSSPLGKSRGIQTAIKISWILPGRNDIKVQSQRKETLVNIFRLLTWSSFMDKSFSVSFLFFFIIWNFLLWPKLSFSFYRILFYFNFFFDFALVCPEAISWKGWNKKVKKCRSYFCWNICLNFN